MSKLSKSQAVGLPESKKPTEKNI